MNKRDAQQHLVAYKDNQREKEYALQHGVLSNFKAKYLEKIPLGNGKFRYIYEEAKDKVKSTANSVSNLVKTGTTNPGKMTRNEKNIRSTTTQTREAIAKQQESAARKAANEAINKRTIEESKKVRDSEAIREFLGYDYGVNYVTDGARSKVQKLIDDGAKDMKPSDKETIRRVTSAGKGHELQINDIMKKHHEVETHTYEDRNEYGYADPKTNEFKLVFSERKLNIGDDGKKLTDSEAWKDTYMKKMLGAMRLSDYGDFEVKNGKVVVKNSAESSASEEQLYFASILNAQLSKMYREAVRVD